MNFGFLTDRDSGGLLNTSNEAVLPSRDRSLSRLQPSVAGETMSRRG
jgi:hypothetical protein